MHNTYLEKYDDNACIKLVCLINIYSFITAYHHQYQSKSNQVKHRNIMEECQLGLGANCDHHHHQHSAH